jgi:WD40 repeat protein
MGEVAMNRQGYFLTIISLLLLLVPVPAFAQKPELVVQTGHTGRVRSVAFSPDGKTLASGSFDNTVKLWDMATGTQLRSLEGHSNTVVSVAFSPDGKTLASSSNTTKLWDVATGAQLRSLDGHSVAVAAVAFSPDGNILASGGLNTIQLWNVATGVQLRSINADAGLVASVAFSPDGKTLASGSQYQVSLWDVATGAQRPLGAHGEVVKSVAFSPDGKTLTSGSYNLIELWDVATRKRLHSLRHSITVASVAFSPDGKTFATGASDGEVELWDLATGARLSSTDGHKPASEVSTVAFSHDGKTLASGTFDKIKLWDVATGSQLRSLDSRSHWVTSVAFSPDGKTLASGTFDQVKLWDMATGAPPRSTNDGGGSVAFSPNGKTLAGGSSATIKLQDVATATQLRSLNRDANWVSTVAFSPDGKILASATSSTVTLWDVATGTQLRSLLHSNTVYAFAFSPDGKTLASAISGTLTLWNVATGTLRSLWHGTGSVYSLAFSPNGKTLAGSGSDQVKLWDVATGTQLRSLRHSGVVDTVAFSPDGKTLVSGSDDNTVKLWDVATGAPLRSLDGHSSKVSSVAFSRDGKTLASGSWDGKTKLWDIKSGQELASLIALDKTDWAVVAPDGLFDGSPGAWNKIIWRAQQNTFDFVPVEAYFADFYYPGLLADIFAGRRPKAPKDISQKDRRQPQVKLKLADNQAAPDKSVTSRTVQVEIEVAEAPKDKDHQTVSGAQDVRLFRNGSLVKVWRSDVLKGKQSASLKTSVPIVARENRLTAYAFNRDNVKSTDVTLVVTGADSLKRKGTAHVLAIGVNEYANPQYNLKYAVADAQGFADEVKRQQERLAHYGRVAPIPLLDKEATKANILRALSELTAKAQPEDAVIVYFAGHGTAHRNQFYLIPHDLGYAGGRDALTQTGLEAILSHGISDRELERAFERVDAGHILLVIDACNSGQALEAEEKRRGPMNSKGLAQLAYEKGMYILTAAQSYQAAIGSGRLGHGYLTYALVEEGLKTPAADGEPKDGQVLLREWLNYATERVPRMQEEKVKQERRLLVQGPAGGQPSRSGKGDEVQRPRVFYRRELEAQTLIIARPGTVQPRE